ncbi:hypothetical protein NXS19_000299 [Fusarium pseudograminearum]|nr:hypothetical protein NXS19_000299 [Fusarium pseudograminearum]
MIIIHDPDKTWLNPIPDFQVHRYEEKHRSNALFGSNAYKAYHFSCVKFTLPHWSQPGYRMDRDIWGATIQESIWETSLPSTERHRADWLSERFAHRMAYVSPYSMFSLKILRKIGRDCLREEAVMELKRLWLRKKKDPAAIHINVDETSTLWIRYIHIEGLKYVRSLSTEKLKDGEPLFTFNPYNKTAVSVFISSDRLGVRDIHIMRPEDTPTIQPTPGVGWNVHRLLTLPLCFKGHFDGLKIRRLRIPEFHHQDIEFSPSGRILHQTRFCDFLWSTIPKTLALFPFPGFHVRIDRNQNDGQQLSNIVQHIDFNKPGTSGYSFCGYRDALIEIIPNDSASLPFDIAHNEGGLFPLWWMYLSLDEGERISELWERIYFTSTQWCNTLILRTDGNRSLTLGPHLELDTLDDNAQKGATLCHALLRLPRSRPCRAFWANYQISKTWLFIENPAMYYIRPNYTPTNSPAASRSRYLLTSVKLEGVKEVTPCLSWREPEGPSKVMGLLLTYTDGTRRSMGQVRHDCMGAAMVVGLAECMWLGVPDINESQVNWTSETQRESNGLPGASSVHLSQPTMAEEAFRYLQVPWRGRLDWRFDSHQCHISHEDEDGGTVQDEQQEKYAQSCHLALRPEFVIFGS